MKRSLAVVVLFAFVVPIIAQAPQRTAILSLVVTDAKGNHVASLPKNDIDLQIGGTPVDLEKFEERGTGGAATGEVRRIAVLFDLQTLTPEARRQSIEAVRAFFARTLRPGDLGVVLSSGQNLRALTNWTADPKQIDAALQLASAGASVQLGPSEATAERRIREIATDIQQARRTVYTFEALMEAARGYAAAAYRDSEQSLGTISATLSLFTPRTRNVLIVAGGGLTLTPANAVFQYIETLRASAQRGAMGSRMFTGAERSSPMGEASSYDLTPLAHTFGTRAWRRGVAVYTIQPDLNAGTESRIEARQVGDALSAFIGTANRMAGYRLLADETGGVAFIGAPPADALARIASDLESFYAAGIHVSTPISGRQAIAVKSKSGYSVRVTRGSTSGGSIADEMDSRVMANQLFEPTDNALGISLAAAPPVPQGERRLVTLDVKIPISKLTLRPEGSDVTGAFTVFIATGDPSGQSSDVNRQHQDIRWPATVAARAGDRALTFRVQVLLEPGRSQISVGVMDEKSQEKGFSRVSV